MTLPEGVERVTARGRSYFYWNPHRGTPRQGERIHLPNADTHPADFWREVERYRNPQATSFEVGTVGYLVEAYAASEEFKRLAVSTQANYTTHLTRFKEVWGAMAEAGLDGSGVTALRDKLRNTPGSANQMIAVGRACWSWARPRGHATSNPFVDIHEIETIDKGHIPWPDFIVDEVCRQAWPDLVRMVRLGIATCQRESDLIRMGPDQKHKAGLWCRPKKTRRKRKSFLIPLAAADALMLERWESAGLTFHSTRWKGPITRHRKDTYLYSPRGEIYTETSLRARWHRWLETDAGKVLCKAWREWVANMGRRYEWDITDEHVPYPTRRPTRHRDFAPASARPGRRPDR